MNKGISFIYLLALVGIFSFSACTEQCDPANDDEVGGEFFTVEYRRPSGQNYLKTVWNPNNVYVYLDTTGGLDPAPNLEVFRPGHDGDKFGPFEFTDRFFNPATDQLNTVNFYGIRHTFDYHIVKDQQPEDVLRVEFFMEVNQCNREWKFIRYYLNDIILPEYNDQRQAEIVIVE